MSETPYIYIALPIHNEKDFIWETINSIKNQITTHPIHLVSCVNQDDSWWDSKEKVSICRNNIETLEQLKQDTSIQHTIIDKCTKGNGWGPVKCGIGIARKTIMDRICEMAKNDDIIISLDADTTFSENYFESVVDIFHNNTSAVALSNPYYHCLTGNEDLDRSILRYEIYMRYYAINMFRIKNPYSFTALGSAIALPVWVYKKIGGITPKTSGEDFYFLQKIRKYGPILHHNTERVYPATRYSSRVLFGTGPALIKGSSGDWSSYPIYSHTLFNEIEEAYELFADLYKNKKSSQVLSFFEGENGDATWQTLRNNSTNVDNFIRACYHKIDGLRILQYLKTKQKEHTASDEECLQLFYNKYYLEFNEYSNDINFKTSPIIRLDKLRNNLMEIEDNYRKNLTLSI